MATSTYKTYLMYKNNAAYEKLVDIKDFPALGGEPELLETTTLSDYMQTYVAGIQSLDSLNFTCNYDLTDYQKLAAMAGEDYDFAVWFGATGSVGSEVPSGSEGKFEFTGQLSVYVDAGEVNAVRNMIITIAPSTPIVENTSGA